MTRAAAAPLVRLQCTNDRTKRVRFGEKGPVWRLAALVQQSTAAGQQADRVIRASEEAGEALWNFP